MIAVLLPEWLTKNERGAVAIVHGGQSSDVLAALISALQQPAIVIADRAQAAELVPIMALRDGPKIDVRLSRGLLRDFEQEFGLMASGPIIIPAAVLESDIDGELRRAQDQIVVLAGYPAPAATVSEIVAHRFANALRRYQNRKISAVVLHDRCRWLPLAPLRHPDAFETGEPDAAPDMGIDLSALERDFRAPEQQELTRQSEFIVRTEMPILVDMHRWLAGPAMPRLLKYWAEQLHHARHVPGHELFVKFAQEKLTELAAALSEDAAGGAAVAAR